MKKRITLALLFAASVAIALAGIACDPLHAADGSTRWPGLHVGYSYRFFGQEKVIVIGDSYARGVVIGYKGNYVSVDSGGDGEADFFVNMDQTLVHCFH